MRGLLRLNICCNTYTNLQRVAHFPQYTAFPFREVTLRLLFQPRETMRASLTIMQAGAGRQGAGRPTGRSTKAKVSCRKPASRQPRAAPARHCFVAVMGAASR